MSTCRSCSAPLIFRLSSFDKWMPLDAEPTKRGNVAIREIEGNQIAVVLGADDCALAQIAGETLYMPHHATCPSAEEWRRE